MPKSDTESGDHTPEHEAEVNEPLDLNIYQQGGERRFILCDPETNRSVTINEEAFIDQEDCQ